MVEQGCIYPYKAVQCRKGYTRLYRGLLDCTWLNLVVNASTFVDTLFETWLNMGLFKEEHRFPVFIRRVRVKTVYFYLRGLEFEII